MKAIRYIGFLACLVVLSNCKKSDNPADPNTNQPPAAVMKYLSRTIHTAGSATDFTDYTYDSKKRLSTIKIGASVTVTYTYDGDNLFSIESRSVNGSNAARNYYEFGYTTGVLKTGLRRIYANDVLSKEYTFTYKLVNGQVTETVQDPGTILTQYTYAGDNLASQSTGSNTMTYTYGDQKSVFTNALAKNVTPGEGADRYSKNNLIKAVSSAGTTTNYTYTFDADGYPITMITGQDKYTYQYVTL